jgi:hypothetical protein
VDRRVTPPGLEYATTRAIYETTVVTSTSSSLLGTIRAPLQLREQPCQGEASCKLVGGYQGDVHLAPLTDFPTTPGAFDSTFNGGSDVFVTKLNGAGTALAYSTFLGGADSDQGQGIAVRGGRAYVTEGIRSADYPTTAGAFDTTFYGASDTFVTKLPTG